ncbi:phosphodiester glycosidase family protein [Candidatus Gracilibacteria bacterium]|nr:phosphodiester glycosidase family protein [Candidatus Gracilibacteria bacterium]
MKKIFFILFLLFLAHGCVEANIFTERKVGDITLRYVTYPIGSEVYSLHTVTSEAVVNIDSLAASKNAISGINGVFFCPADYTECGGQNFTINERFIEGRDESFYNDTGDRGVFGWNTDGTPFIYQTGQLNHTERLQIYEGLGNFPIIFFEGRNMLEQYHDLGLIDRRMTSPVSRHFICSNQSGTEIYFGSSTPTSLDSLAPALYGIGCYNALNLDAGASTQFLYNGRRLASGSRNILDGFVISHSNINVGKIEAEIKQLSHLIEIRIKRQRNIQRSQEALDRIIGALVHARNDIYNKYSVDIQDESGSRLRYRLEVTDISELTRVYKINKLERSLRNIRF